MLTHSVDVGRLEVFIISWITVIDTQKRHFDGNISKPIEIVVIEIVVMVFEIGSKKVAKFGWFSELYQDGNHNVDKINVRIPLLVNQQRLSTTICSKQVSI